MKTIDVPVEGWEDAWDNEAVNKMVSLGKEYFKNGNLMEAKALWEEASSCGNDHATFLLALLAKRQSRYIEAEKLLQGLLTRHTGLEGNIAFHLAEVYQQVQMPISALGYLLMAKEYGVEICDVEKYRRAFNQADVEGNSDAHGCYIMGSCLYRAGGPHDKVIYYLTQAVRYGQSQKWVGYAALDLAEAAKGYYENLSRSTYLLAEKVGYPQILKKKRSDRHD